MRHPSDRGAGHRGVSPSAPAQGTACQIIDDASRCNNPSSVTTWEPIENELPVLRLENGSCITAAEAVSIAVGTLRRVNPFTNLPLTSAEQGAVARLAARHIADEACRYRREIHDAIALAENGPLRYALYLVGKKTGVWRPEFDEDSPLMRDADRQRSHAKEIIRETKRLREMDDIQLKHVRWIAAAFIARKAAWADIIRRLRNAAA